MASDPLKRDSDGDGLSDGEERRLGTDPNNGDSDGDGLSDYDEVKTHRTDPSSAEATTTWLAWGYAQIPSVPALPSSLRFWQREAPPPAEQATSEPTPAESPSWSSWVYSTVCSLPVISSACSWQAWVWSWCTWQMAIVVDAALCGAWLALEGAYGGVKGAMKKKE